MSSFTSDAFTGTGTRTGQITFAGANVTVPQVGTNYVAVKPVTSLASGLSAPTGVAVDGADSVFIADGDSDISWHSMALRTVAAATITARIRM